MNIPEASRSENDNKMMLGLTVRVHMDTGTEMAHLQLMERSASAFCSGVRGPAACCGPYAATKSCCAAHWAAKPADTNSRAGDKVHESL